MPRLSPRQDAPHLSTAEMGEAAGDTYTPLDGLLVNNVDAGAAHRAEVRALNSKRQQADAAQHRRLFPQQYTPIMPRRPE